MAKNRALSGSGGMPVMVSKLKVGSSRLLVSRVKKKPPSHSRRCPVGEESRSSWVHLSWSRTEPVLVPKLGMPVIVVTIGPKVWVSSTIAVWCRVE